MSQEQPTQPVETQVVGAQRKQDQFPEPQVPDAHRRLRELLAIPDRERTDALWDEIVKLELELGPGNRVSLTPPEAGCRPDQARRQQARVGVKPTKRFARLFMRGPREPKKT